MKRACLTVVAVCLGLMATASHAAKPPEEGTTAEALSLLKLPVPSDVKVAVLPLWDYTSNVLHQRIGTAAIYKWLEHEGFQMLPILAAFKVQAEDKDLEPGYALRKSDAMREGATLECDWVVYGEIKEVRVYEKDKLFGSTKKILCSMRLSILDCKTGDVMYWKTRQDTLGDSGLLKRKSTKLIRVALQTVSEQLFKPFFAALPKHEVKGARPSDASLLEFEKSIWPEGGD